MKRRILLEIQENEEWPDSMLEILARIANALEQLRTENLVLDFSVGLESDVTWFVKLTAKAARELPEPEPIKVLKDPARSYKKFPTEETAQK